MLNILIMGYLSYRNGLRAKTKGQSPVLWGLITFFAYFFALVFGMYFVILTFCKDSIDLTHNTAFDYKASMAMAEKMDAVLAANPLRMLTIWMIGFGGYLLVRYIIDRKPDKKEPEVHWMDKMGQGGE